MEKQPLELEPRYTSKDIPGKCIQCLAEQKLDTCLRELLKGEDEPPEQYQQYEALLAFLQSPESEKLRAESEKYLSEGKQVKVCISYQDGKPKYELKIN